VGHVPELHGVVELVVTAARLVDRLAQWTLGQLREWAKAPAPPPQPRRVPPRAAITVHGPDGIERLRVSEPDS
jgi:hypothetical protein